MKTYEMYTKAIEDGKTYKCKGMYFNTLNGFHDDKNRTLAWEIYRDYMDGYEAFISEGDWEEVVEERAFTLEEIEKHINEYYTIVTKGCDAIIISMDSTQTPKSSISKLSEYIFNKGRRV